MHQIFHRWNKQNDAHLLKKNLNYSINIHYIQENFEDSEIPELKQEDLLGDSTLSPVNGGELVKLELKPSLFAVIYDLYIFFWYMLIICLILKMPNYFRME